MLTENRTATVKGDDAVKSWTLSLPFVAPFFAFMLFLSAEGYFPDEHYLLYPFKTALVGGVLAWYWRALPSLVPSAIVASATVGILGVLLWVGLDPWANQLDLLLENVYNGAVSAAGVHSWAMDIDKAIPLGRDPFSLYPATTAWTLFAFRVAGISLCVPIMEELFWRGFLMRWLIKEDFTSIPLGTYCHFSFWTTTAFFALAHGAEWPLGVVVGLLYGYWFVRTKSLGNVMVAHGVTNFLLALYCLASGDWHFLSAMSPVHK